MAEIQTKRCVVNIFRYVFVVFVIVSTANGKNHAAGSKNNPQIENQLGCETLYVTDTVISRDMSQFNRSCLRIMVPPGMGIRMDFQDVNSSWSIFDFFYIQMDQNCGDNGIVALTGKPGPCSTLFNASALTIHFHASVMVNFSSSFTDTSFPYPICNVAATVDQSHDFQPCTKLENFNRVYNFTHKIIHYSELMGQYPSLDLTTFPDSRFKASELPLLNLATTGKLY